MSVYNILIGKDDSLDTSTVGMTHAVMVKLLEGLEGRGHHVSPALFGDLRCLSFGVCGTVRINRRGVPLEMKAPLKKGETTSMHSHRQLHDGTEVDGQAASGDVEHYP